MQEWYNNTTAAQKVLMYVTSVLLILFYGAGVLPLLFLLYFEFGKNR